MMNVELLKLALVVALCSNAILLGVLLFKTTGSVFSLQYECCQQSVIVAESGVSERNEFLPKNIQISQNEKVSLGYGDKNFRFLGFLDKKSFQRVVNPPTPSVISFDTDTHSMEDFPNHNRAQSIRYQRDSDPRYSVTKDISKTDEKHLEAFHSQLKFIQQHRLKEIKTILQSSMAEYFGGSETYFLNIDKPTLKSSSKGNMKILDNKQIQSRANNLDSHLDFRYIRTKRSHRSDIEPESERTQSNQTNSSRDLPKRPGDRRQNSLETRKEGKNFNKTEEAGKARFRNRGDRAFRRASRIAKRRMSKGKHFQNKKMRRVNEMKKIFSALSDEQVSKMSEMVTNVLLPSLVQFENLVGSHITGIRSAMVSQELRIEKLEKTTLEMAENKHEDKVQNDEEDNLTEDEEEEIKDGVEETLMTSPNITIRVQVFGKEEGSGEEEDVNLKPHFDQSSTTDTNATNYATLSSSPSTTSTLETTLLTTTLPSHSPTTTTNTTEPPTTTTPTTLEQSTTTTTTTTTTTSTTEPTTTLATTTKPPEKDTNYEELYQFYSSLNQKVDEIQNQNMLSSTELHRTQNMAIKMDDKVTELARTIKNMKTRDSRQLYRINELEIENSRVGSRLEKAMKDFERIEERFNYIRDHMDKFKNNVHKVNAEFAKYEQISEELRAADAYKAHDILDVRESVMNVENRVNGIYRVVDEGAIAIRYEVEEMVQRVCAINKLVC